MTSIKQGTPEWLEAKQKTTGASEIFSLVYHYCAKELRDMGFDLNKERPFRTVQELFLKIKFGAKLSDIDPIHSEFGNGMEPYIAFRLSEDLPKLKVERSKEFVINEGLHPLAACSPDGYVRIEEYNQDSDDGYTRYDEFELDDFDKTCKINSSWGKGAMELKTSNYFANFDKGGCRLAYIFQLQYQLAVMGLKWGCLAAIVPKEKQFDDPFFKGRILEKALICNDEIDQYYNLNHYIYPILPVFQQMIMKALNCFQLDLDGYDQGKLECFPRNCEDLNGLQREKQLWAQLWPEKFGTHELAGDDQLDQLLNERYKCQEALMFAEQDKLTTENKIQQLTKLGGFDKYCEVKGSEHRMSYTKNGQVRFYKLKEAKA